MKKYDSQKFIDALINKIGTNNLPECPFCHGKKFSSTPQHATIILGDDLEAIQLGTSVPSGMVICQKCGHIEFFALGALGLLNNEGESHNGGQ